MNVKRDWTDSLKQKAFRNFCKDFVQKEMSKKNLLVRYARDKRGNPYGVIVGIRLPDGDFRVGYSKCHSKLDRWNKYEGIYFAVERGISDGTLPFLQGSEWDNWCYKMQERSRKYWKRVPSLV